MASFSNKISVLIDVTTDKASSALRNFKTDLGNAEGGFAKLKVAGKGAFDSLKQNAGQFAVAGGAALVAFGLQALEAFTGLAKSALDFSSTTGLAVEDASRWIAIGDDVGLSAETLSTNIGKIGKSLDSPKWGEYGIATRGAGGEARAVNDILLDSLDMLGRIENQTERTRIGNDLFGKGYGALSPLIGKTREEYQQMLATVSGGQVITQEEAEKAEKMRLAQDALKDAIDEVTLAVGGLVAGLSPAVQGLADTATKATELFGELGPLIPALTEVGQAFLLVKNPVDAFKEAGRDLAVEQVGANTSIFEFAKKLAIAQGALEDAAPPVDDYNGHLLDLEAAGKKAKQATKELDDQTRNLLGTLNADEALINFNANVKDYATKAMEAKAGSDEQKLAIINLKQEMVNYVTELQNVPASKKTEILTLISEGDLQGAQAKIDALTAPKSVSVAVDLKKGAGWFGDIGAALSTGNGKFQAKAKGGPVRAGEPYLVGEEGPEIVVPDSAGTVLTNAQSFGGSPAGVPMGGSSVINITTAADPQSVINAIKQYERTNGKGWRA